MTLFHLFRTYCLETVSVAAIAIAAFLASAAIASAPQPIETKASIPLKASATKDGSRVMPGARLHGWGTGRVWH